MAKAVGRRCFVPGCTNNKKIRPDLVFFQTPKDPERTKIWLQQIGLPADTEKTVFICEEHFEKSLINKANLKKRLESIAVPTLKLLSQSYINFTATEETPKYNPQTFLTATEEQEEEFQSDATEIEQKVFTSIDTTKNWLTENEEILPSQAGTSQESPTEEYFFKNTPKLYRDKIVFDDDDSTTEDPDTLLEPAMVVGKQKNNEYETSHIPKRIKSEPNAETVNAHPVLTIVPNATRTTNTSKVITATSELHVENESNHSKTPSFYQYMYPGEIEGNLIKTGKTVIPVDKDEHVNDTSTAPYTLKLTTTRVQKIQKDSEFNIIKGVCSTTVKIHEIQTRMKSISSSKKAYQQLSLKLYFRFPKEYKMLQNLLYLPCESDLKEVFRETTVSLEKDDLFAKFLMAKITCMTVEQRQCFISVGEIDIKPRLFYNIKYDRFVGIHDFDDMLKPKPATKAVVIIVQGIYFEWKQLVSVGYLEDKSQIFMKNWIEKNIKALIDMGLYVRAVVTNNTSIKGSNYCYQTYNHYLGKNKYYCLNDISSLFKSFYYNFFKYDYMYDDVVAKSNHIVKYYELDRNRNIPLTPKLTNKHMNPQDLQELTIDHVLEVFNMTTAAAISMYIDLKILDESARHTVKLIIRMRSFYDLLNTGQYDTRNKIKKGFGGGESQIVFLKEMLLLFDYFRFIDSSTGNVISEDNKLTSLSVYECIEKFKLLIKSVLSLFEDLKFESFQYLPVWRFNTDATEKFSDKVQKYSKSITKPTATAVDSVFRQIAVLDILKPFYDTVTPVTPKLNLVLQECQDIIKSFRLIHEKYEDQCLIENENASSLFMDATNYNSLDMKRKNGLVFIAGYLLKKCYDIHETCIYFKKYFEDINMDDETRNMSESIKEEIQNGTCVTPTAEFIEFVEAMEILFRTFMNKDTLDTVNKKIVFSLLKSMRLLKISAPCQCMPLTLIKKLYLRFRIYHVLKYNNQRIKTVCKSGIIINEL